MAGRRPEPVIGKLVRVSGSGILGSATSPRSPLEIMEIQSQKALKRYDFGGSVGIGLGIVAALEKSEPVHLHKPNAPVFARNRSRSILVPEVEMEKNEENYTCVTCHGPNKANSSTRVHYDGDDYNGIKRKENIGFDKKSVKSYGRVVFDISPARFLDDVEDFPKCDFLSFCNLCRKNLHGKDIYMYRGEKAFCSEECRKVEILKDERKEKQHFGSKLVSSTSNTTTTTAATATAIAADISTTSPYNTTINVVTRILAT